MIVAGIITAVVFVIALSRSAGLADRKEDGGDKHAFRRKRGGWRGWELT